MTSYPSSDPRSQLAAQPAAKAPAPPMQPSADVPAALDPPTSVSRMGL